MSGSPSPRAWPFFVTLSRADGVLAAGWWTVLILRGLLPVVFGIAMGQLVAAIQAGRPIGPALTVTGVAFVLLQVLAPIHQAMSANLGDRTASWLYDRLSAACLTPPGMRHLEDPSLTSDLTVARDFDLGMTGPPLAFALDFIAGGLVRGLAGLASVLVLAWFVWWAPLLLALAWGATHWLLKESGVWRDRNTNEVRSAQRDADYAYRLAVDAPAAKELRLFGLAGWTLERFIDRRRHLHRLQFEATRLRERPLIWSLLIVLAANAVVFWRLADDAATGAIALGAMVVFAQSAIGASNIAFGGLNWAMDSGTAPVAAVLSLEPKMAALGDLPSGSAAADGLPRQEIRFRDVTFAYPGSAPVLEHFDLTIPAGSSLAIVGQNGAGKTTLAKLLCRLYDPQSGVIEVDGIDIRRFDITSWRSRVTAVFQDFIRHERSLRENVAPAGADDTTIERALTAAGARQLASLDTVLARGYDNGTDLSGGQWQRVALARALCAVAMGRSLVLLDEPTAQLDVRGEAEIFERLLTSTRHCTTILISHRFSTVRHADRICVLEHGRVVELGSHDELMSRKGRYCTMFELQAQRFNDAEDEGGVTYDVLS